MNKPLILITIALVTILIAATFVGTYYLSNHTSDGPSSSSSITQPLGQTAQSIVNFTSGLNAKYTIKTYDISGKIVQEKNVTESIAEGTFNGNECWRIIATAQIKDENTQKYYTLYISKSTLECLHIKTQTYSSSIVIDENETDDPIQAKNALVLAEAVDPQTFIDTETVTVTAGIFENATKAITNAYDETCYIWVHPNVVGYGLVRMESYGHEKLLRTVELIDYTK